jgi:hypothetical protein
MNLLLRRVHLGPVAVALCTDEPVVLRYLSDFYTISDDAADDAVWTVDARLGSGAGMRRNPWGVAFDGHELNRVLCLRAGSALDLAMTTRKALREALVEYCERHRYVMLHASAFADEHRVVLVVGDKGSGKTTLALRAFLHHGCQYVSNDHLILYPEPGAGSESDRLVITSLPTPIPLKVGTYLDLERRLPPPWDDEGLDIARFWAMPAAERYRHDQRLLFTYPRLGQTNPIRVTLGLAGGGPRVVVVLARYAEPGAPVGALSPVGDPQAALWPHVREDWPFDSTLNTQHLPRAQRDRVAYTADARRLLGALADRAPVVTWAHHGDPRRLLDQLRARS